MPINVQLINDNRVALQTYSDPLDHAQMTALRLKMEREILPLTGEKIHIIADFSGVKNLPGTILSSGAGMMRGAHPNTGVIICVTSGAFVNAMAAIFTSLFSSDRFKIFRSLDEAYKEIDQLLLSEA